MNINSKSAPRRRGLILTKEALQLVDSALREKAKTYEVKPGVVAKKLTNEIRQKILEMDLRTVKKIYHHHPADEVTLRHVFEILDINPPFSKELHCVYIPPFPKRSTTCIGRDPQTTELIALLKSCQLVTLVGVAGVGKSRLAIHIATKNRSHYPDYIWFADLSGVSSPDHVQSKVAATFGIEGVPGLPVIQTLSETLSERKCLLILDNCEHQRQACSELIRHLLDTCPDLKILATSRERLNMQPEENIYEISPLSFPDPKHMPLQINGLAESLLAYPAVRLFIECAKKLQIKFTFTDQDAMSLANICYQLDGIPLSIELASAHLRDKSIKTLSDVLNIRMLNRGNATAAPHQQSLWETIHWSYNLLQEKERKLIARLSVFKDGWTSEAATKVCSDELISEEEIPGLMTSLCEASLVVGERPNQTDRYRMLWMIREFAEEKLAKEASLYNTRHRDYFLNMAESEATAQLSIQGVDLTALMQRLEREHENFSSALKWSLDEVEPEFALRLCGSLQSFWGTLGYLSEGLDWCKKTLSHTGSKHPTKERAKVLNGAGAMAYYKGDYALSRAYHQECLLIRQGSEGIGLVAVSLNNLGLVVYELGEYELARTYHEKSLSIRKDTQDKPGTASSYHNLGTVAHAIGDFESALECYEACFSIWKAMEDNEGIAYALNGLGSVACSQGKLTLARTFLDRSQDLFYELGDVRSRAASLHWLGLVSHYQGDFATARSYSRQTLQLRRKIGDKGGVVDSLDAIASLIASQGQSERAVILWSAVASLRQEIGTRILPYQMEEYNRDLTAIRIVLGETDFEVAWATGRIMLRADAEEYALRSILV